jgi:hypothetical protein
LESVMAVYRNLRENYEYRLRYDEAVKFFTKEMELKRKYRNDGSKSSHGFELKENCWFRSPVLLHLFYISGRLSRRNFCLFVLTRASPKVNHCVKL